MNRLPLIIVCCLLFSDPTAAEESTMTAHELAEATLLAEWVGVADQQHVLATSYYKGDGVPRDFREAFKWYQKAADQDFANSQYMLAVMYDNGQGVPRNYPEAVKWYRKAAEQGMASAQYSLANKYAEGRGFPQNYAEAYLWFSLSAATGFKKAASRRDSYAKKLSLEELSEAQKRSAMLFEEIQKRKQDHS